MAARGRPVRVCRMHGAEPFVCHPLCILDISLPNKSFKLTDCSSVRVHSLRHAQRYSARCQ